MRLLKKILYVHDESSDFALSTLKLALELAKRNSGRVDIINVFDTRPAMFGSNAWILMRAHWLDNAEKSLQTFIGSVSAGTDLKTTIVEGRPHIEVVHEVIRNDYDLVIKPIGSYDLIDRLLGRLDMQLLRYCPCPVWLSKGGAYGETTTVLAAVDVDKQENESAEDALNKQILEFAFLLCADSKAQLHVGHVWYLPFASLYAHRRAGIPEEDIEAFHRDEKRLHRNWLNRLMRKANKWMGPKLYGRIKRHTHLLHGRPGQKIPELIKKLQADVVVMGTVARTGISGLIMGNTAEQILDHVTCSVLAVKPPNFVSPVRLEG